ncbi:MAG: hypothetical protein MJ054_00275 [Clostridia bacterium]|nr:hypothetical protein [Clostridia bacterium]
MDKRILSRIFLPLVLVVLAVLWAVRVVLEPSYLSWYSFSWAVTIFLTATGLKFVLDGIFMSGKGVIAGRLTIIAGAVVLVLALICLTSAITIKESLIAPIIAIIITVAIFIGILVTGGRKWDAGDNQSVGYKNYYQRKKSEKSDK